MWYISGFFRGFDFDLVILIYSCLIFHFAPFVRPSRRIVVMSLLLLLFFIWKRNNNTPVHSSRVHKLVWKNSKSNSENPQIILTYGVTVEITQELKTIRTVHEIEDYPYTKKNCRFASKKVHFWFANKFKQDRSLLLRFTRKSYYVLYIIMSFPRSSIVPVVESDENSSILNSPINTLVHGWFYFRSTPFVVRRWPVFSLNRSILMTGITIVRAVRSRPFEWFRVKWTVFPKTTLSLAVRTSGSCPEITNNADLVRNPISIYTHETLNTNAS